jgi:hypothetical protein
MVRVHVLVEGQTEETFAKRVSQPHLNLHEVFYLPGRSASRDIGAASASMPVLSAT